MTPAAANQRRKLTGVAMYCPKCNARLEEDPRGLLRCSTGELTFSMDLSQKLRSMYGAASVDVVTTPDLSGREFYCPRCGLAIQKGTTDAICSSCHVSLRPLVWALIELHPHGDGAGNYF